MAKEINLDLKLEEQFFLEKVKNQLKEIPREQLETQIIELMKLMYKKDKMWLGFLNEKH